MIDKSVCMTHLKLPAAMIHVKSYYHTDESLLWWYLRVLWGWLVVGALYWTCCWEGMAYPWSEYPGTCLSIFCANRWPWQTYHDKSSYQKRKKINHPPPPDWNDPNLTHQVHNNIRSIKNLNEDVFKLFLWSCDFHI